jgi:hypothetical protein
MRIALRQGIAPSKRLERVSGDVSQPQSRERNGAQRDQHDNYRGKK